jgi:hypothetical protein
MTRRPRRVVFIGSRFHRHAPPHLQDGVARSAVTAGPDMPNRDLLTAAAADAVAHDRSPRS